MRVLLLCFLGAHIIAGCESLRLGRTRRDPDDGPGISRRDEGESDADMETDMLWDANAKHPGELECDQIWERSDYYVPPPEPVHVGRRGGTEEEAMEEEDYIVKAEKEVQLEGGITCAPHSYRDHRKRPIYFEHVSGSAGTALHKSRPCPLKVSRESMGSNLACGFIDGYKCLSGGAKDPAPKKCSHMVSGCQGLADYVVQQGYDVFFTETVMPRFVKEKQTACDQLVHVLAFKNPLQRIASYLRNYPDQGKDFAHKHLTTKGPKGGASFDPNAGWHSMSGTPAVNNAYIRYLLGSEVFFLPPGGITRAHLEQAKEFLKGFAAVIPLDKLSEDGAFWLREKLGWGCVQQTHHQGPVGADKFTQLDTEAQKLLREHNQLDMELYEWSHTLFNQTVQELRSCLEEEEKGLHCTGASCPDRGDACRFGSVLEAPHSKAPKKKSKSSWAPKVPGMPKVPLGPPPDPDDTCQE